MFSISSHPEDLAALPKLIPAWNQLIELKIDLPEDLLLRAADLVGPVQLIEIGDEEAPPNRIVDAWGFLLDNCSHKGELSSKDEIARLFLLLFFRYSFDRNNRRSHLFERELRSRLTPQGRPLNLGGTWFEATRRLAGGLYNLGRRGSISEQSIALLKKAVELFDLLISRDKKAIEPRTRCRYVGMRGVSNFFLARVDDLPAERYESALRDLEESGDLGNRSLEHDQYLVDCYLHLYDIEPRIELLDKAEGLLSELSEKYTPTRTICFAMGEVFLRRGFILANEDKIAEAFPYFQSAADRFSQALDLPEQPSFLDDQADYLRMKRGHARLRLFTSRHQAEEIEDEDLLDLAIEDLGRGGSSLPSALLLRSIILRRNKKYGGALEDLERALPLCSEDTADTAELVGNRNRVLAGIGECKIWLGIDEGDSNKILQGCETLLNVPTALKEVNSASLFYGTKYLISHLNSGLLDNLIERVVANIEIRLELHKSEGDTRRFDASHAASLILEMSAARTEITLLERAYRLYNQALLASDEPGNAELYGRAGETALKIAKLCVKSGNRKAALDYLEDASELFLKSLEQAQQGSHSEFFSLSTAHSKLGETYVRLNALTGGKDYADGAISHLQASRSLGNEAPELVGLIGDAYYRRGRALRSKTDLLEAITHKQASKAIGDTSRENASVRAAANMQLWKATDDVRYLQGAIESAIEAVAADETWAWPFFQMAEIAALPEPVRREAVQPINNWESRDLVKLIRSGNSLRFYQKGCDLSINSNEFDKNEFKSRQLVYVLDDPHRLLNRSFVFKHTPRCNADREISTHQSFGNYLSSSGAPSYFELPEPVLTMPLDADEVVYMMRRAQGVQLGQLVIDWLKGRSDRPYSYYKRTLQYLAYFHAWGAQIRGGVQQIESRTVKKLLDAVLTRWQTLGVSSEEAAKLKNILAEIFPRELPALLKKDAHPENWLVTPKGHVVMLDLEATSDLPLFFEVVQLVEDYPILPNDEFGWQERLLICEEYLQALRHLGFTFSSERLSSSYAVFALLRAAFGYARINNQRRFGKESKSSSALRAGHFREHHYLEVIRFLAKHGDTAKLKQCADVFLSKAEILSLSSVK
jgi:tetratricopeptide (TPR) repeat protein